MHFNRQGLEKEEGCARELVANFLGGEMLSKFVGLDDNIIQVRCLNIGKNEHKRELRPQVFDLPTIVNPHLKQSELCPPLCKSWYEASNW